MVHPVAVTGSGQPTGTATLMPAPRLRGNCQLSPTDPMTPRLARLLFTYQIASNRTEQYAARPTSRFIFDFRAREAEHLLASLSLAEIPTLLSRAYPVRYSMDSTKSFVYESLHRRAQQALGARGMTPPGHDAYMEWRRAQLELFRELLGRIPPRPGYSARTLQRLVRRVDQEAVGLRAGTVLANVNVPARRGSADLMDELTYAVEGNWDLAGEMREAILAVDRCSRTASWGTYLARHDAEGLPSSRAM